VRFALIILGLTAIAVGLVHIRRAELGAQHEIQRLQLQQVQRRRRLWDQQITLSRLTAPGQLRRQVTAEPSDQEPAPEPAEDRTQPATQDQ
jgi:hypothetical protein